MADCPCGSGGRYASCCGPVIDGIRAAVTAEDLMRSRFTAFAIGDEAHLARTWATPTRPRRIYVNPDRQWTALEVLDTRAGRGLDSTGEVEFRATFVDADGPDELHERSTFTRENGRWVYVDGVRPAGFS